MFNFQKNFISLQLYKRPKQGQEILNVTKDQCQVKPKIQIFHSAVSLEKRSIYDVE